MCHCELKRTVWYSCSVYMSSPCVHGVLYSSLNTDSSSKSCSELK